MILFLPTYAFWACLLFTVSLSFKEQSSIAKFYIGVFLLPALVSLVILQYLCFGWGERAEMLFYLRVLPLWLVFVGGVGGLFWFRQKLRQSFKKIYSIALAGLFFLCAAAIGGETISLLITREQCLDVLNGAFPSEGILGEWLTCAIWKVDHTPADI